MHFCSTQCLLQVIKVFNRFSFLHFSILIILFYQHYLSQIGKDNSFYNLSIIAAPIGDFGWFHWPLSINFLANSTLLTVQTTPYVSSAMSLLYSTYSTTNLLAPQIFHKIPHQPLYIPSNLVNCQLPQWLFAPQVYDHAINSISCIFTSSANRPSPILNYSRNTSSRARGNPTRTLWGPDVAHSKLSPTLHASLHKHSIHLTCQPIPSNSTTHPYHIPLPHSNTSPPSFQHWPSLIILPPRPLFQPITPQFFLTVPCQGFPQILFLLLQIMMKRTNNWLILLFFSKRCYWRMGRWCYCFFHW